MHESQIDRRERIIPVDFQNFSTDEAHGSKVRSLLTDDELLVAIVETSHRFVSVTSKRLIIHYRNNSGDFSVINNRQISFFEVSSDDDKRGSKFVKVYFGGGLGRMLGAPDGTQAAAIISAAGRG